MVVVPLRHGTFSNIPIEVALWAREGGPIAVTSTAGGFADQIEAGVTRYFVDIASKPAMTQTLQQVLDLSPHAHAAIRRQAYQHVVQSYDFAHNFSEILHWFWQPAEPERDRP